MLWLQHNQRLQWLIHLLETFEPGTDNKSFAEKELIHADAKIGNNTIVYPGAVVMDGAEIGENCILYPNSVIEKNAKIGDQYRC